MESERPAGAKKLERSEQATARANTKRIAQPSGLAAGIAGGGAFRWFAVDVTDVTRSAQQRLDLGPLASVAFGRAAAGAAMLLRLSSKTPRRLILDVRGSGPLRRVLVEVGEGGSVRGLVGEPHAQTEDDPLDVAAAVGIGLLRVRREERPDSEARVQNRPVSYESQVELISSEIGTDIAYYLQQSEQRRSAIAVGVDVGSDGVRCAAGFLVEALPSASSEAVAELERSFPQVDPVSRTLPRLGPAGLARSLFSDAKVLDRHVLAYRCRCSGETLSAQLAAMPSSEISSLSEEGVIVAECAYCGEVYRLDEAELLALKSAPS